MNPNQSPNLNPQGPSQQPIYGSGAGTPQQTYDSLPPPSVTGRPTGHNPYEFIVNPNTPKKPGLNPFGGGGFGRQIMMVVGGGVVLVVVLAIIASIIIPNKNTTPLLLTVVERQQEIIRVATLGAQQATTQATKNFTLTTQVSVTTNQSQLLTYLAGHGSKPTTKQLALAQSKQTDQTLTAAQATSTFDSAVQQNLKNQLATYQDDIQAAFNKTSDTALKALLQQSYAASSLLVKDGDYTINTD